LPGDYLKIVLRLVQLANWKRSVTPNGVELDAGEALISLRSSRFWDGVELDRDLSDEARMALLRRVIARLERDGYAKRRPARCSGTGFGTPRPSASGTPATIIRFLRFRDVLWPSNSDSAHTPEVAAAQHAAQALATIQAETAEPDRTGEGVLDPPARPRASGGCGQTKLDDVRALLKRIEEAFAQATGRAYQHADPRAIQDDRRAAARLLELPGNDADAIESAWRQALIRTEWPRIDTLADLARHWARIARRVSVSGRGSCEPPEVAASADCLLWAEIAAELREAISGETFMRWFAPLSAAVEEGELILFSPDRYHCEFVNDNYRSLLEERARAVAARSSGTPGPAATSMTVRIEVAQARALASVGGSDQ
jgi:hypothetical protein